MADPDTKLYEFKIRMIQSAASARSMATRHFNTGNCRCLAFIRAEGGRTSAKPGKCAAVAIGTYTSTAPSPAVIPFPAQTTNARNAAAAFEFLPPSDLTCGTTGKHVGVPAPLVSTGSVLTYNDELSYFESAVTLDPVDTKGETDL